MRHEKGELKEGSTQMIPLASVIPSRVAVQGAVRPGHEHTKIVGGGAAPLETAIAILETLLKPY
jgi:hypothetical protein